MAAPVRTLGFALLMATACAQAQQPGVDRILVIHQREQEVLSLMVEGADRRKMAATLHLSSNTVRTHVQNVMSKLGVAVAGLLAASVITVAVYLWLSLGDSEMSTGGYVAMILGGLGTLGLGAGLMALLFYSHRKGFDERAGAAPILGDDRRSDGGSRPDR